MYRKVPSIVHRIIRPSITQRWNQNPALVEPRIFDDKTYTQEAGVFSHSSWEMHDSLHYFRDDATGLRAIVGIHDTLLGPALGGCRLYPYKSEKEALFDVLRLSRGMTFKAACAGLSLGGGKAVIFGPAPVHPDERGQFMRCFGKFVQSLNGRYITAEDVGVSVSDMVHVKAMTQYCSGIPTEMGGSGNPGPYTAHGVYLGMQAAIKYHLGKDSVQGLSILLEGLGSVGWQLGKKLARDGAHIIATDINQETVAKFCKQFGASSCPINERFDQKIDVYSPNALGGSINDTTIPRLKCKIVAGAANNQLMEDRHALVLKEKGILYVPDYVLNAGGLINVSLETAPGGWSDERAMAKLETIPENLTNIFKMAEQRNMSTLAAGARLAVKRLSKAAYDQGSTKNRW